MVGGRLSGGAPHLCAGGPHRRLPMLRMQADKFVLQASALHDFLESLEFVHLPSGIAEMLVEQGDRPRRDPLARAREDGLRRTSEIAVDMHKSHGNLLLERHSPHISLTQVVHYTSK